MHRLEKAGPMDCIASTSPPASPLPAAGAASPIALERLELPRAIDPAEGARPFTFRFLWRDVPFSGALARHGAGARLTISGELGPLPFTAEAAQRRQRALRTITAACHWTELDWRLTPSQDIAVSGALDLPRPVSPAAMIAGAVGVLARGDAYLALLLDVLGDAASLIPAAA